jgi:cyclic dehypoxanthinyl futalosine synthase
MRLSPKEALQALTEAPLLELGRQADQMRQRLHCRGVVSFVVDRNINYTNICVNRCRFCAFWRPQGHAEGYVLSQEELYQKIQELLEQGGTQVLLQGGLNPALGLDFFLRMLKGIKKRFPQINVHGFSPPEVAFMARGAGLSLRETLLRLKDAGLGSIPGGGAEVLSERVRKLISPRKQSAAEWLQVMRIAHQVGLKSSATMMFGSLEGPQDILEHLQHIRALQDETGGFVAFIPWSFQPGNTALSGLRPATAARYLRILALSRLYLDNITNIQASWVTQGLEVAQVALRFGANDMGSTMLEENVVASAGVRFRARKEDIVRTIREAGFRAAQRDTFYNIIRYF